MGNPDGPTPPHIVDKLVEAAQRQDTHGYSVSKGIPRLRRAICALVPAPLRRRARPGHRGDRHHRLEGGPRAPDARARSSAATRCWCPTRATRSTSTAPIIAGADIRSVRMTPGRGLLRRARARHPRALPQAEDADHRLSVEPDRAVRRARVLRADRGARARSTTSSWCTTSPTPTSCSTASRRPRSCRCRARATSRSSSSRMSKSYNMAGLAHRLHGRQQGAGRTRWRASRATTTTAASRRCRWPRSRRSKARRTASTRSATRTRGAATCWRRACTRPAGWSRCRRPRCTSGRRSPTPTRRLGSIEFTKQLLEEAKVAVSPGIGFGDYGDDHVRIALIENEHRTAPGRARHPRHVPKGRPSQRGSMISPKPVTLEGHGVRLEPLSREHEKGLRRGGAGRQALGALLSPACPSRKDSRLHRHRA